MMNPLSTFETKNCAQLSFVDYFMLQYKIQITDLKQPLLENSTWNFLEEELNIVK